MRLILATHNPSKAKQIKEIFSDTPFEVVTLTEANIAGEAVEDGETLEENALKKVLHAREQSPESWVMADDTGLFINALNGFPGVHSARWLGDVTTEEIMHGILKKMDGIEDRSAAFKTSVVLMGPDGKEHIFSGERKGQLLKAPRCAPQPKMPYSSIFLPDGANKVWAEMKTEEENVGSHRGKAFRQALEFLKQHT